MILHPNPKSRPDVKLLEMFENKVKVAELDIGTMTTDEIWAVLKIQERLNRTWTYKTIRPYNWKELEHS